MNTKVCHIHVNSITYWTVFFNQSCHSLNYVLLLIPVLFWSSVLMCHVLHLVSSLCLFFLSFLRLTSVLLVHTPLGFQSLSSPCQFICSGLSCISVLSFVSFVFLSAFQELLWFVLYLVLDFFFFSYLFCYLILPMPASDAFWFHFVSCTVDFALFEFGVCILDQQLWLELAFCVLPFFSRLWVYFLFRPLRE